MGQSGRVGHKLFTGAVLDVLCQFVGSRNIAIRILKEDWVVAHIYVTAITGRIARKITAGPPPQPRRVISSSVIVQSALLIPFLARVSIPLRRLRLAAYRLVRRAAIRI